MLISVDPAADLAIYEQVVRQVKFAIAAGALQAGELVPSVRELSRQLAINPNTVARAYQQLQAEEVLENVRGTGLAVTESAGPRCRAQRAALIRERLRRVLREALHAGLGSTELQKMVSEECRSLREVEA